MLSLLDSESFDDRRLPREAATTGQEFGSAMTREGTTFVKRFAGITVVGIVALAMRLSIASSDVSLHGDARTRYDPLARNLSAGNGFSKATSPPYAPDDFDLPGYPYFVAAIYRATRGSARAVVLAQLVLELAIVGMTVSLARQIGLPRRAAAIALALGLLEPFLPTFSGSIVTEVLATFCITLTCLLLVRASSRNAFVGWLGAGLAGGLSLLVRPDLVVSVTLLFAAAAALALRRRRSGVIPALLIALVAAAACLTPWMIRNRRLFGELRPFGGVTQQTKMGYVRWLGTWLVSHAELDRYWWGIRTPTSISGFPSNRLTATERSEADEALRATQRQGSLDGEPSRRFAALADAARWRRPLSVYVVVPVLRVGRTVAGLPRYGRTAAWQIYGYCYWAVLLGLAAMGVREAIRLRRTEMFVPGALVLGRVSLPFVSALAVEPRYVVEALPAGLLLAAMGASAIALRAANVAPEDESDVRRVVELVHAVLNGAPAANRLAALTTEDWTHVDASGRRWERREAGAGKRTTADAAGAPLSVVSVRFATPEVAVVTTRSEGDSASLGEEVVTWVLVKREGRWRVAQDQATRVLPPEER